MNDETRRALRRYIGRRIKDHWDIDGIRTSEEFAEALTAHTGRTWTANMVRSLVTGRKEITLVDLCDIAGLQGEPLGWYWEGAPSTLRSLIPGMLNRLRFGLSSPAPLAAAA